MAAFQLTSVPLLVNITSMSELSHAARSVFESFNSKFEWVEDGVPGPQFKAIAAALRAAADQVVPMALCVHNDDFVYVRHQLRALADELEAQ